VSPVLPAPHTLLVLVALAAMLLILRAVAWRLWQLFWPQSTRLRAAQPEEVRLPDGFEALTQALAAIGFSPLGARLEHPRLRKPLVSFDFANPKDRAFATLTALGREPRLYFVSPLAEGRVLLTQAGIVRDEKTRRFAWSQHSARSQGQAVPGLYDAAERLALARAWYAGEGKREIRRQHAPALLWSLLALGMVAWVFFVRT